MVKNLQLCKFGPKSTQNVCKKKSFVVFFFSLQARAQHKGTVFSCEMFDLLFYFFSLCRSSFRSLHIYDC